MIYYFLQINANFSEDISQETSLCQRWNKRWIFHLKGWKISYICRGPGFIFPCGAKGYPYWLSNPHMHQGWLLSTHGSRFTSLSHDGTGLTAQPQTDQVQVFLLNLSPVCASHTITSWIAFHSWMVLRHNLCPDLHRHLKASWRSTLKKHPLHRSLQEVVAQHIAKGNSSLSASVKLCPGITSPSQSWTRRNQDWRSSTRQIVLPSATEESQQKEEKH